MEGRALSDNEIELIFRKVPSHWGNQQPSIATPQKARRGSIPMKIVINHDQTLFWRGCCNILIVLAFSKQFLISLQVLRGCK